MCVKTRKLVGAIIPAVKLMFAFYLKGRINIMFQVIEHCETIYSVYMQDTGDIQGVIDSM